MRLFILLASTSLLAACGGGGPQTIASAPPPAGSNVETHSFVNPLQTKTYIGIGGSQVYEYTTDDRLCCNQQAEIYAGNATTVRDSGISITYDPSGAVYTLTVQDELSGASADTRFQDPASRTDFDGNLEPQWGTPQLSNPNIQYLQAGDGNPRSPYRISGTGYVDPGDNHTPPSGTPGSAYVATSLFVLKPGTETQYVTYAGYARNSFTFREDTDGTSVLDAIDHTLERGAFAFGELTPTQDVPATGTGTYQGSMLATMIFNPTLDGQDISGPQVLPSYFQWIEGSADLSVDFAKKTFDLSLDGTVLAPQIDTYTTYPPQMPSVLSEGATFSASGEGTINLVNFGGFKGAIDSASFANPNGGLQYDVAIEGSSIDGAFYGPNGEEAGGGFRIVGGTPDERIDILGAFAGGK